MTFGGETIVRESRIPELDACRVLLARGLTGTLLLTDAVTGQGRISVDMRREPSSQSARIARRDRALPNGSRSKLDRLPRSADRPWFHLDGCGLLAVTRKETEVRQRMKRIEQQLNRKILEARQDLEALRKRARTAKGNIAKGYCEWKVRRAETELGYLLTWRLRDSETSYGRQESDFASSRRA